MKDIISEFGTAMIAVSAGVLCLLMASGWITNIGMIVEIFLNQLI